MVKGYVSALIMRTRAISRVNVFTVTQRIETNGKK